MPTEKRVFFDIHFTAKNPNRPGNVIARCVETTESWWGNYTARAFNLSCTSTRTMTADDIAHMRIYVPKK